MSLRPCFQFFWILKSVSSIYGPLLPSNVWGFYLISGILLSGPQLGVLQFCSILTACGYCRPLGWGLSPIRLPPLRMSVPSPRLWPVLLTTPPPSGWIICWNGSHNSGKVLDSLLLVSFKEYSSGTARKKRCIGRAVWEELGASMPSRGHRPPTGRQVRQPGALQTPQSRPPHCSL